MKEILRKLYENGGNCVSLGRSINSRNPDLYKWIFSQTTFLNFKGYITDNERIYCILNDITSPVYDHFGKLAIFTNIFRGYSLNKHTYEKYLRGEELRLEKKKRSDAAKQKKEIETKIPLYKKKLKLKIQRVERLNKELYDDDKIEGYDYVICPETNLRMCMIKENYIKTCLNMTKVEYKEKYPNIKFICDKRMENVKKGLKKINKKTGLTTHQTAIEKTKKKLSKIDKNGLSGYDKLGQKTRASHVANVDEFGRNGYQQQAYGRVTTVLDNGLTVQQNADKLRDEVLLKRGITRNVGASKQSKRELKLLIEYLNENNIKYYFDKNEFLINDNGKIYFYDLTIPLFNIVIEYQSNSYHADPRMSDHEWNTWKPVRGDKTATEVLNYDYQKARIMYRLRGFVMYYIWESTQEKDIKDIICLLKTINMK